MRRPVALGFRSHSGWSMVVAVGGSPLEPVVLERRRIETASPAIPGSRQPYHAAERLEYSQAETLICSCRDSSFALARQAVGEIIADLERRGHKTMGSGLLSGSGRPLPDLATTLQSHALIHTAEGEFFREVLVRANEHCALPLTTVKEREVWQRASDVFHVTSGHLQQRINELARSLGQPWRQDEKLASLVAWIALAESA